jgi:hypothetical protein
MLRWEWGVSSIVELCGRHEALGFISSTTKIDKQIHKFTCLHL